QIFQVSPYHVEPEVGHAMADVRVVVDGHTAHVHANLPFLDRLEGLLLTRKRVVDDEVSIDWAFGGFDRCGGGPGVCPSGSTAEGRNGATAARDARWVDGMGRAEGSVRPTPMDRRSPE